MRVIHKNRIIEVKRAWRFDNCISFRDFDNQSWRTKYYSTEEASIDAFNDFAFKGYIVVDELISNT